MSVELFKKNFKDLLKLGIKEGISHRHLGSMAQTFVTMREIRDDRPYASDLNALFRGDPLPSDKFQSLYEDAGVEGKVKEYNDNGQCTNCYDNEPQTKPSKGKETIHDLGEDVDVIPDNLDPRIVLDQAKDMTDIRAFFLKQVGSDSAQQFESLKYFFQMYGGKLEDIESLESQKDKFEYMGMFIIEEPQKEQDRLANARQKIDDKLQASKEAQAERDLIKKKAGVKK